MAVRIQLDTPYAHFTNLDFITGKAVLTLVSDTPITSIVVKLEGESRTRLAAPKYPHGERSDKKRTEVEVHKLLYKVETLFPSRIMRADTGPNTYYTLSPGTYEYPFRFKFPFNSDCVENQSLAANISMAGLRLDAPRDMNRHLKRALPPSLGGYAGEAEIKYYVKATVARPQFYKENYRNFVDIKFFPIEPPRRKNPGQESYARRQQQFARPVAVPEKKGLFSKVAAPSLLDTEVEPPRYSVDVRLPSPAILTCNEPLPLRILVKKLSDTPEVALLQMLQIELIGYTRVRAHDLERVESTSWVIMSQSRMNLPLGESTDPVGKEYKIEQGLWNKLPLPSSVAPSFETCNLARYYTLEIRVGLSRSSSELVKSELIVIPLRMNVEVYSGIAPPQQLLDAMNGSTKKPSKVPEEPAIPAPRPPPRPEAPPATVQFQEDVYEDAPPSYEDAMADALAPVDGPRREYNPPEAASQNISRQATDVKGSVGNPKDDERLFPPGIGQVGNASTESLPGTFSASPVEGHYSQDFDEPKSPLVMRVQTHPELEPEPSQQQESRPEQHRRITPNMGVPKRKPLPNQEN